MFEEITSLDKRDYVTAKELWLLQKHATEILSKKCSLPAVKDPGPKEYITDKDLEIKI
ncbi:hypothetical protein KAR91_08655 [Candidatus Pacearchaeota archaeon]|nr:hypothetical protein [Candidatus Pacearchaeota archaeon]